MVKELMKRSITACWILLALGTAASAQSPSMTPTRLQPQPTDPAQQQLRQARSALFDNLFGVAPHYGAAPIENDSPASPPRFTTAQQLIVPELPAAFADTIIVGRITNIQAYESNDQRAIYTESTVQVEQVMSQEAANAVAGGSIVFEQTGGGLLLPSGRVLTHLSNGLGTPFQQGGRYAFFLTHVTKAQCYRVTKAWWLNDGTATAMSPDDLGRARNGASQYNGLPESTFINILKSLQASYKGN
ncbi:exported hypothetical protein [Candidatus Sulfopaludibacter sp. SbA4]|nr:exported hypothetical protein [Candidatus Sulfopaludibacter sp. SbA4]